MHNPLGQRLPTTAMMNQEASVQNIIKSILWIE